MEVANPFEEEVPEHRKLVLAPVSKHRAGRTKPLSAKDRKRARAQRMREERQRISAYLNAKAVREAVDGPGA